MTILSKQFPMDLGTGSIEQVRQSAPKIDMELGAIYGHLNNIRTRYRSATAPTNPEAGQVWEDTVNNKIMKWNGSAWVEDIAKSVNLTNRNTVLQGQVSSAGALELILGSTVALTASLVSSAIDTIIAIPAGHDDVMGNSDYIVSFTATQTDFWSSLPANNTSYLFVDHNAGTVTGTYTVVLPVFQSYAPTHSSGKHWYDTNKEQWYVSDGSNWVAKYRVYVGSVVTDGTKVTATTIRPYNELRDVLTVAYFDTDGTLAANSDEKIATQKAVKTYVDNNSGGGVAIGTGNYIAEPFTVTAGTGLEVVVAANRCVIDETVAESTASETVSLTARYAQLVYKKKDNTYDILLADFSAIDASTVLRWVATAWDGSSAIATSIGTNNLTKNGTVAQSDGRIGYGATGNGSNGYFKAANTTNIPAYTAAGTHHHAFRFISNGAAQCFYNDGVVEIACTSANNLRVGGVDTAYTLMTQTDYKVSVSRVGNSTTGIVYANGSAIYEGAVIVNTTVIAPNVLSNNSPAEYSPSMWHGTMIDNVVRTPAQIATLAQKLLIPCAAKVSVMVAQNVGTPIGDMTAEAGISSVFNGVKIAIVQQGARRGANNGYVGKDWGDGTPKIIRRAICYSSSNGGFDSTGDQYNVTLSLLGYNDNIANAVTLATQTIADANNLAIVLDSVSSVYYRYHVVRLNTAIADCCMVELEFFTEIESTQTDIRNALANPTESQAVAFVITSATVPTTIIAPNDPKGSTPDWAYGMRIGPNGILNKIKRLGRKLFSGTSTPEWANPFGSRNMTLECEWSLDAAGKNSSPIPNDAANSYPSVLINGKIRETITTGVNVAGVNKTSGYIDIISEVID